MSSLISRLQTVNDRLGSLPVRFGDPRYQKVVLLYDDQTIVLNPQPMVLQVEPRRVGQYLANNVEIEADDQKVSLVSRSYSRTLLTEATYILNATQNQQGKWQGDKAECLNLDESELMTYSVLVRKFRLR